MYRKLVFGDATSGSLHGVGPFDLTLEQFKKINNSYLAKGEQGGLLVDSWTPEQEVVGSKSTNQHGLKVS